MAVVALFPIFTYYRIFQSTSSNIKVSTIAVKESSLNPSLALWPAALEQPMDIL